MRVDTVLQTQLATLAADAALIALLGGAFIYARDSVELVQQIPGVYWSGPSEGAYEEGIEPSEVQWDIWAFSIPDVRAIELRLRQLLHFNTPQDFGGVTAWSMFNGSVSDNSEKKVGVYRRIMNTEIQAVRVSAA